MFIVHDPIVASDRDYVTSSKTQSEFVTNCNQHNCHECVIIYKSLIQEAPEKSFFMMQKG